MKNRTMAWMCLVAIVAAALAGMAWYYPRLPETVASHFNARGEADGWTNKQTFALMQAGAIGMVALVFVPLILFLPRMPKSIINLPRKDYWLAPERAEQTCREIGDTLLWFANATMLFMASMMLLTFRANLHESPALNTWFWIYLGTYMAFAVIWSLRLVIRYGRSPTPTAPPAR